MPSGTTTTSLVGVDPQLPQILLGFPVHEPPGFEDSEALRELAAIELNVPVEDLGCNGDALCKAICNISGACN